MATFFMYDYFLTLSDEVQSSAVSDSNVSLKFPTRQIKYAWKGGRTWSECYNPYAGCREDLMTITLSVLCLYYRR